MTPPDDFAHDFLSALRAALDAVRIAPVEECADALADACRAGRAVFVAGNGGSATTASHFASDLAAAAGGCGAQPRVTCLNDNVARITALANDHGYEEIFRRPLLRAARPDDVVVLFSVSGASENVRRATDAARERGAITVGIFGAARAGRPQAVVDQMVSVESDDFAVVESVHAAIEHLLVGIVRARLLQEG